MKVATGTSKLSPADDPLLDAARECILAVGVRRTTLTDVARRAGVSRMTLYRRWPDVQALLGDLATREVLRLAATTTHADSTDSTGRARLVQRIMALVRALRDHPLLRKIIEVDPDWLLPYLLQRRGRSVDGLLDGVQQLVRAGHADGSIRAGDPAVQARALVLAAQPYVLSLPTMLDGVSRRSLDAELALLLDRYLSP